MSGCMWAAAVAVAVAAAAAMVVVVADIVMVVYLATGHIQITSQTLPHVLSREVAPHQQPQPPPPPLRLASNRRHLRAG